jgi:predicted nuclease of predicted toxin-antitoxin system
MKIVIDMCLSPDWCDVFAARGWEVVHWSTIGAPNAPDRDIAAWAKAHGFVVFTNDLDFAALLAASRASGPSIIQVRAKDLFPDHLAPMVLQAIDRFSIELSQGALLTIDESRCRARVLPIGEARP